MQINLFTALLASTAALIHAAAVPRCEEDLQFVCRPWLYSVGLGKANMNKYNHCIEDASKYLESLNVRVTPEHTSRINKCYHCFQEAAAGGCGMQFGTDPDNLTDEGRACYDVGMETCRARRTEHCRFFVNWSRPTIEVGQE